MKRAFVAGAAVIGTALSAYSIKALGLADIQEAFARMGWGFGAILFLSGALHQSVGFARSRRDLLLVYKQTARGRAVTLGRPRVDYLTDIRVIPSKHKGKHVLWSRSVEQAYPLPFMWA